MKHMVKRRILGGHPDAEYLTGGIRTPRTGDFKVLSNGPDPEDVAQKDLPPPVEKILQNPDLKNRHR